MSNVAIIKEKDMSLVEDNALTVKQLNQIFQKTPAACIKSRPAKGGGTWNYVDGTYVRKVLNLMFGWDWDFEIVERFTEAGEAIVLGKLTCRVNGRTIVKQQFGNKDIITKRNSTDPLSIGNDYKAAATDALKKCAQDLGIAQDVYAPNSFKSVKVESEITLGQLVDKFEAVSDKLTQEVKENVARIIENKEVLSYEKAFNLL